MMTLYSALDFYLQHQENFRAAVEYFKKAVDINSENSEAYYELGYCYENLEMFEEALDAYNKYIEISPL